jgi:hypothetical protein
MNFGKSVIIMFVCSGLLAGPLVQPRGAQASPPKLEMSNGAVIALSGVAVAALVTAAVLTHEHYVKSKEKESGKKMINTAGQKVDYRVKSKEEMKKELEQMREEGK